MNPVNIDANKYFVIRLEKVEAGGNWLYPFDQISPIEI